MKVSIVTQGLGVKSGGPSRSILALSQGLRASGVELHIHTSNSEDNPNLIEDDWIKCVNVKSSGLFGYVSGFKKMLSSTDAQLYHIQGLFSYIPMIAPWLIRKLGKPYIVAPRGMLYANA